MDPSRTVLGPVENRMIGDPSSNALYQIPTFLTTKNPTDISDWIRDFSNALDPGDTIASIAAIQIAPGDLEAQKTTIVTGTAGASTAVQMRLSGGTVSLQYAITISITTANGSQLSRQAYLCVEQM